MESIIVGLFLSFLRNRKDQMSTHLTEETSADKSVKLLTQEEEFTVRIQKMLVNEEPSQNITENGRKEFESLIRGGDIE